MDEEAAAEAEAAAAAAAEEKNKEPSLMAKIFKSAAFQVRARAVWLVALYHSARIRSHMPRHHALPSHTRITLHAPVTPRSLKLARSLTHTSHPFTLAIHTRTRPVAHPH